MKPRFQTRPFVKTLFIAITLAMPAAQAVELSWDPTASLGAALGGATIDEATEWKTSGSNIWWDGSGDVAWTNGNDATFAGTAGTVNLGSAISAGTLTIGSGYTINLRDYTTTGTGYNLTVTAITGAGTVTNSATAGTQSFTVNNTTEQSCSGAITSQRLNFVKQGTGTLNYSGALNTGATFTGDSLSIQGGNFKLASGFTMNQASISLPANSGSTLDLNGIGMGSTRSVSPGLGTTVTNSSLTPATITLNYGGSSSFLAGNVTGATAINLNTNASLTLAGTNTFSGGLSTGISGNNNPQTINAISNSALSDIVVLMNNSQSTSTTTLNFRSAAPVVGSLASANFAVKNVVLGNSAITVGSNSINGRWTNGSNIITNTNSSLVTVGQVISDNGSNGIPVGSTVTSILDGTRFTISNNATITKGSNTAFGTSVVNTTLSVGNLNTNTTFAGIISQASGTTSGINKIGTGSFSLLGAASYTGTTTISNGTLIVGSGAALTGASVNTTLNNNTITYGVGQLPAGLGVGQSITGTNIPVNAIIVGINTTTRQVYMSANASATGASTPSFGAWQSLPTATNVVIGTSTTDGTLNLNNSTQRIVGLSVGAGATAANQKVGNGSTVGDATLETTGTSVFDGVISDVLTTGNKKTNLKVISGSLTLAGANTYTGTTNVSAGTLLVNGSLDVASNVTVESIGTLGGTGTVDGTVTIDGTLAPGASAGTLNTGATVLNSVATLAFELNGDDTTVGSGINDLVAVTGNLTLDGTLNVTESVAGTFAASAIAGDSYRLINVSGGSITNNGLNLGTMPALPGGLEFAITTSATEVNLVVQNISGGGNTYADWLALNAPATGFETDSDNDGVSNGVENILGTSPNAYSAGLTQVSATPTSVTYKHKLNPTIASDVTPGYQWSTDLVEWKTHNQTNTGGVTATIVATGPSSGEMTVVTTVTGGTTSKLFTRLIAIK